jgi:zinc transporter ZupT
MLSLPQKSGTKVGAILYGLLVGISAVVVIVFGAFVLGALGSWVHIYRLWDDSGEYQAWLPIILGEYAIVPAIVVGAVICWKIWKSRLR